MGENSNRFKRVVEATEDIKNGFCRGLDALSSNSKYVNAVETRKIDGSVDIDTCTKFLYPNEARWDYTIGYDNRAYFLEIHPANTRNVEEVIRKSKWLDKWLTEKASLLKSLSANNLFYWVPSGKVNILNSSPQYRRLSQSKIKIVSKLQLPIL